MAGGVATAIAVATALTLSGCAATEVAKPAVDAPTTEAPTVQPSAAPQLDPLVPVRGAHGNQPNGPVLARIRQAQGSRQLPVFVPHGQTLYVTFACLGPGHFVVGSMLDFEPCEGRSGTLAVAGQRGAHQRLVVRAPDTMTWRLLITSGK
jgi:hypothetical protein